MLEKGFEKKTTFSEFIGYLSVNLRQKHKDSYSFFNIYDVWTSPKTSLKQALKTSFLTVLYILLY